MATPVVDLNADVGESFGAYRIGSDEELFNSLTSVNIACGWHAGDPLVMDRTVRLAARLGLGIGAHPGYPDLLGFGRRNMEITAGEATAYVLYQLGALEAFARAAGCSLRHVKLHGAFYNQSAFNEELSDAVLRAIAQFDSNLIVFGLSGSPFVEMARGRGLGIAHEVFADRGYNPNGSLVLRGRDGALIEDEARAAERAVRMVTEGRVRAVDGSDISIQADTICIHGDRPGAPHFARVVREALEQAGVKVAPGLAAR